MDSSLIDGFNLSMDGLLSRGRLVSWVVLFPRNGFYVEMIGYDGN